MSYAKNLESAIQSALGTFGAYQTEQEKLDRLDQRARDSYRGKLSWLNEIITEIERRRLRPTKNELRDQDPGAPVPSLRRYLDELLPQWKALLELEAVERVDHLNGLLEMARGTDGVTMLFDALFNIAETTTGKQYALGCVLSKAVVSGEVFVRMHSDLGSAIADLRELLGSVQGAAPKIMNFVDLSDWFDFGREYSDEEKQEWEDLNIDPEDNRNYFLAQWHEGMEHCFERLPDEMQRAHFVSIADEFLEEIGRRPVIFDNRISFADSEASSERESRNRRIREYLRAAVDIAKPVEDHYAMPQNMDDEVAKFLANDNLWHVLADPHFSERSWVGGQVVRSPVVSEKLSRALKDRLMEIHRSLLMGNYFSVIALARAVLEYALIENARRYGVATIEYNEKGYEVSRSLNAMAADYSRKLPGLEDAMEQIRTAGNDVMHPANERDRVRRGNELVMLARRCANAIRKVIEELYI